MAVAVAPLKPAQNWDVLNAIRNEGTPEYQQRIPEATKANIQTTLENLTKYNTHWNEFVGVLVNQIGLIQSQNISWTNPLKEFKKGLLTYGDTIEDYMVGLIQAQNYNPDRESLERDLFGTHSAEVQANFHRLNRQDVYPITLNEPLLRRAFFNPEGLSSFAADLMAAPMESDEWDEFLLMSNLFAEYERNGGFFKVKVPDLSVLTSTQEEARTVLRIMRAFIGTLKFRSRKYNAAKMSTAAKPEDLVIFCTPEFRAAVDVDALAGAFNVDRTDLNARIIDLPAEYLGIDGAQAIMTTRNFFIVGDTLFQTTSQQNARTLSINYFLHHHQIISASRFVPAILFTTKGGDEILEVRTPVVSVSTPTIVDGEGETVTEVERGMLYALDSRGVTNPADGVNDSVRWKVTGAESNRTYITSNGVLHVGIDEPADSLTVRAISTWIDPEDPQKDQKSATLTVTVTGETEDVLWPESEAVTGITVEGVAVSPAFDPDTLAYTVVVPGGTTTLEQIVVEGPDTGDVTITLNEAGDSFTVYAPTAPGDPTYTVTVN